MSLCQKCANVNCNHEINPREVVVRCGAFKPPMTNADRIRAMTDDELVNWIADIKPFYCQPCVYEKPCRLEYDVETVNYAEKYDCKDGILKWLQQPAEEDDHES